MSDEKIREDYLPRPPEKAPRPPDAEPRRLENDHYAVRRYGTGDLRKAQSYLRTLSIFYYIAAVLFAVFGLFPGIYVFMGIMMVSGAMGAPPKGPPPEMGFILIAIGSTGVLLAEAFAVCLIVAGRSLVAHKRYVFCFVIAILLCLNGIPVMILGVFSIVVLASESVKELFAHGDRAFGADPDDD